MPRVYRTRPHLNSYDSVNYWQLFDEPKILYPDIAWRSQFALDQEGYVCNNTVYLLPSKDTWLLALLNSPPVWWFSWRAAVHGKDEALRFFTDFVETLPIAQPSDADRAEAEPAVARLIALTGERRAATREVLDWLRVEFSLESPGQRLEAFATLDEATFLDEVRRRRPRAAGRLTPAALRDLRDAYARYTPAHRTFDTEAIHLETRLATLVNDAYGLTPADVALLWRTAPPRMPLATPIPAVAGQLTFPDS